MTAFGRLLGVVAALGLAAPVSAQQVQAPPAALLLGTLRDSAGTPLPGAQVIIRGSALVATADSLGRYRIAPIPPGRHAVVVNYVAYYRMEFPAVDFAPGDSVRLDVRLVHLPPPHHP